MTDATAVPEWARSVVPWTDEQLVRVVQYDRRYDLNELENLVDAYRHHPCSFEEAVDNHLQAYHEAEATEDARAWSEWFSVELHRRRYGGSEPRS